MKCHNKNGDASDSKFVLQDASQMPAADRSGAMLRNCQALTSMASLQEADGRARLLLKATGGLEHGGGEVVKAESAEYRALQDFVRAVRAKPVTDNPGDVPGLSRGRFSTA